MRAREWATTDTAVAGALTLVAQLEVWAPRLVPGVGEASGSRTLLALTCAAATTSLAVRRRFPLAVVVVVLGALALQQLLTTPNEGLSLLLTALLAAYGSSAYAGVGRAAVAGGVVMVGSALIGSDTADWAFLAIVLGGAWLLGFVLRQARDDNRDLEVRLAEAADQLALAQRESSGTDALGTLTPREVQVARAVARGLSNAEVAAELVISEWTVKTHVASILRKLGLRDRAQVVVAAYESGLVRPRDVRQF